MQARGVEGERRASGGRQEGESRTRAGREEGERVARGGHVASGWAHSILQVVIGCFAIKILMMLFMSGFGQQVSDTAHVWKSHAWLHLWHFASFTIVHKLGQ